MAREKLLKNSKGEYNYHFNWINENGTYVGFNDVWAPNKREAVKLAKKMERPVRWMRWDSNSREYVNVEPNGEGSTYFEAMLVDVKSMYKATRSQADTMNRIGWMLTI